MLRQQHQIFVALLAATDALIIIAACVLAWIIRRLSVEGNFPAWPSNWESYVKNPSFLVAVPVALVAMRACGLYAPRRDKSIWGEQGAILRASIISVTSLVVVLWLAGSNAVIDGAAEPPTLLGGEHLNPGRVQMLSLSVLMPVMLGAHRAAARGMLRWLRRRGQNLRHIAIVGVGRLGQVAGRTIERNSWTGLSVSYFISAGEHSGLSTCLGRPVHGGLADLERALEAHPVDAVYLALPNARSSRLPEVLRRLERFAVDVRVIPDVLPRYMPQSMTVSELDGMPILTYRGCPMHGLGGASKRVLDMVGSLAGLVLLSPIMVVCAILVRLSSPGPIIFKQRRVSIAGETFKIYKFRTMYHVEDEAGPAPARWTTRDDPRITPVGRLLRRTSLDELPQLLNVLKGQMSLVGPRPERPELIERFRDDWRGYMIRQHVKAGITGWAQVNGLRGETSLRRRLRYDLHYIRNWSLSFDLKILVLTLFRGFVHRNAH